MAGWTNCAAHGVDFWSKEGCPVCSITARAEVAEAERDRLRDALRRVILATHNRGLEFATVGMRVAERCEDIASAALATPPKSGT